MIYSERADENQYDAKEFAEKLINEEWGNNKGSELLEEVGNLEAKVGHCEQEVRNLPDVNAGISEEILQDLIQKNQRLEEQIESISRTNEDLLSVLDRLEKSVDKMNRPNMPVRAFKSVMGSVKNGLITAFSTVRSAFSQFKEKAGKLNESLKTSIKEKMDKASESLSNAKENLMDSLSNFKEAIKEIPSRILEAVKGIATSIKDVSKDISDKAVKGIKSAGTAIKDTAKTTSSKIVTSAKTAKDSIKENAPKVAKAAAIGASAVVTSPVTVPTAAAVGVGALAKNVAQKTAEKVSSAKDSINLEMKRLATPSDKESKKLNQNLKEAKERLRYAKEEVGKTRYGSVESLNIEKEIKEEESKISKLEGKQVKGEILARKYENFKDRVENREERRSESVSLFEGTKRDINKIIDAVKDAGSKFISQFRKDNSQDKTYSDRISNERSNSQSQDKGGRNM